MDNPIIEKDLKEIFEKGQEDGSKLYATADSLHKLSERILILFGIIGVICGIAIMDQLTIIAGVIVIAITLALCALIHMIQIIITNSSKVLVHILFTNLALLKKDEK